MAYCIDHFQTSNPYVTHIQASTNNITTILSPIAKEFLDKPLIKKGIKGVVFGYGEAKSP